MPSEYISKLIDLIPPPAAPLDTDDDIVDINRSVLFISDFPDDYKEFGKIYGSGTLRSAYSWEVWSPGRVTLPSILMDFARTWFNYSQDFAEENINIYRIFPQEGGLLPFSKTSGGDWVCWLTEGEPNDWPVVDMGSIEKDRCTLFEMGFAEYFYRVLTQDIMLEQHSGDKWDPKIDLSFEQVFHKDKVVMQRIQKYFNS